MFDVSLHHCNVPVSYPSLITPPSQHKRRPYERIHVMFSLPFFYRLVFLPGGRSTAILAVFFMMRTGRFRGLADTYN